MNFLNTLNSEWYDINTWYNHIILIFFFHMVQRMGSKNREKLYSYPITTSSCSFTKNLHKNKKETYRIKPCDFKNYFAMKKNVKNLYPGRQARKYVILIIIDSSLLLSTMLFSYKRKTWILEFSFAFIFPKREADSQNVNQKYVLCNIIG